MKHEGLVNLTPDIIKLLAKVIKLSKGGLTAEERKAIAEDLILLADKVLDTI